MSKIMIISIGVISSLLSIRWFPTVDPFTFSFLLAAWIFNPLKIFAALSCFFISFFSFSSLIRSAILETYMWLSKNEVNPVSILLSYSVVGCFIFLFQMSFWTTIFILFFSLVYGIISLDLQSNVEYELEN